MLFFGLNFVFGKYFAEAKDEVVEICRKILERSLQSCYLTKQDLIENYFFESFPVLSG